MTTLDGYQMALQGRGGVALGIAAIGSFIAGTLGTLGLMLLAPPLGQVALAFGPPEYFALVLLGLTALAAVGGSVLKGLATGVAGLLLGTIGIDPQVGVPRFDFGQLWLLDGVDFIVLAVALFGVGEVLASSPHGSGGSDPERRPRAAEPRGMARSPHGDPARQRHRLPDRRAAGAGATIASFARLHRREEARQGPVALRQGRDRGRRRARAANNAASAGAMVPMFALGVPGSSTTAVMLAALIMFGLRPGPDMFTKQRGAGLGGDRQHVHRQPDPAGDEPAARRPVRAPARRSATAGSTRRSSRSASPAWSRRRTTSRTAWLMLGFGVLGWLMKRYDWSVAPMILGLVLGPMFENSLRQSLTLSHGSPTIFVTRPISAVLLALALIAVTAPIWTRIFFRAKLFDRIGVDINQKLPPRGRGEWTLEHKVPYIDLCLDQTPELLQKTHQAEKSESPTGQGRRRLGLHTLSAVNIAETSPFVSTAADEYLAAYIDAAARLGAGWIVVHGGYHFGSDKKRTHGRGGDAHRAGGQARRKEERRGCCWKTSTRSRRRPRCITSPTTSRNATTTSTGSTRRRSAGASPSTTRTSSRTASTPS